MAHRYTEAILVRRARAVEARPEKGAERWDGAPVSFKWRDMWYQVDAVLATWRLRDRWWAAPIADVATGTDVAADALPPTERVYYRVRCVDPRGEQIFDLYYDAASGRWLIDRAHD